MLSTQFGKFHFFQKSFVIYTMLSCVELCNKIDVNQLLIISNSCNVARERKVSPVTIKQLKKMLNYKLIDGKFGIIFK